MLTQISDLITAANVGIMLFFSVAVAPTIFMVLPPEWSAAYVRKFFPKYFLFLGITSAIAAALHSLPVAQLGLGVVRSGVLFQCVLAHPAHQLGA